MQHHPHTPFSDYLIGISDTGGATTKSHISHQGGRGVSRWGSERRSEPSVRTVQSPPQPSSPTRIYPQDSDVSDFSAALPSNSGSGSSQRPMLTPLPRQRPVSTSSHSSLPQHSEPSVMTRILLLPRNQQQRPSIHQRSNQHLGWAHSKTASDRRPLSRELTALPSPRQRDVRVSRPASSIPPGPGHPLGAERVIPGRYIVSLLRVFKQFTHTLPSR